MSAAHASDEYDLRENLRVGLGSIGKNSSVPQKRLSEMMRIAYIAHLTLDKARREVVHAFPR
jgi:hypothetical protein